jgi:hypothetical protein
MNKKCLIINIINNIIYKSLSLMKFWLKCDTKLYHIITDNIFFFYYYFSTRFLNV